MRRIATIVLLLAAVAAAAGATWWFNYRKAPSNELLLYGNVDLRQVELPFNDNERIATVLVQEGDHVRRGQVLAELDTGRLVPQVTQAQAQVAAQRQVVERLHNGSRPEEIAQARANAASTAADSSNARRQYERVKKLFQQSAGQAVSQQDVDNAEAAAQVADAKLVANQKALELSVAGPRKEEVAENEARLRAQEAQLAFLCRQLADAQLKAPMDAVVRTRLMEPGEMASPQKAVYSLAIVDPKWIRAYVSEVDLGKVHPGMTASIMADSFPDRRFQGWIGFISPVAEFTPKTVQTDELRTALVYEVRVFVKDPSDDLRLGMPATVSLALGEQPARPASSNGSRAAAPTTPSASTLQVPAENPP
ncbi:MAG TPA: efflux RND transporter periplasmic adaptor subunit [Planctomycetaceae bacterium]|jgi:HlyD family secretion protein|nr:efflux RND transporter periplasmic adaptor subunit [Planctomycetaceae bacterium]